MFSIFEIESNFQAHLLDKIDPECLYELGKLCQQWLLSFAGASIPAAAAAKDIQSSSEDEINRRMTFALAASMCVPGKEAAQIIHSYEHYIYDNSMGVTNFVIGLTNLIHPHHPVDILATFDALTSYDLYDSARRIYGIFIEDVRWDAVAWDNLKIFEGTLPENDFEAAAFSALARYPIDLESKIHRKFVKTREDESKLFTARLNQLRSQMISPYNNGYCSSRQGGEKKATLCSSFIQLGTAPSRDVTVPLHKEPGFDVAIHQDLELNIEAFFKMPAQGVHILLENFQYVDEITQAFLGAGIDPEKILSHGPWNKDSGPEQQSLSAALDQFCQMSQSGRWFYSRVYKAYFAKFSIQDIINNTKTSEALAAVYEVTGNRDLLQAARSEVREFAMSYDLGL